MAAAGRQAVDVVAILGIAEVIVPPAPGITSAVGLTATDMKYDLGPTAFVPSADTDDRHTCDEWDADDPPDSSPR